MHLSSNKIVYGIIACFLASVMSLSDSTTFNKSNTNYTFNNSALECDVCEFIVQETESFLLSNKSLTEIQNELDSVCQKTKYDKICEAVVNSYLPKIIQLLEQEESPEKVCLQINLCSENFSKK